MDSCKNKKIKQTLVIHRKSCYLAPPFLHQGGHDRCSIFFFHQEPWFYHLSGCVLCLLSKLQTRFRTLHHNSYSKHANEIMQNLFSVFSNGLPKLRQNINLLYSSSGSLHCLLLLIYLFDLLTHYTTSKHLYISAGTCLLCPRIGRKNLWGKYMFVHSALAC